MGKKSGVSEYFRSFCAELQIVEAICKLCFRLEADTRRKQEKIEWIFNSMDSVLSSARYVFQDGTISEQEFSVITDMCALFKDTCHNCDGRQGMIWKIFEERKKVGKNPGKVLGFLKAADTGEDYLEKKEEK